MKRIKGQVMREKFATQVDSDLLTEVRNLARKEGRQIQSLVDEAFAELLESRRGTKPSARVMAAYEESLKRYDAVYKKLAE